MIINNDLIYFLIVLFVINFVAFIIMLIDKNKAVKANTERISEGTLFFMASAFGAIGVYLGMFVFKHKTRKWYFLIGIPLLIIQNIASFYLLYLVSLSSYFH